MNMLDQIDPNLRDVVERLRGDPTSLLYRGGQGGFPSDFGADRLRPMSKDASARKAERHLLERYSEELAVWLLRGVFLEKGRLGILPWAMRLDDPRERRTPPEHARVHEASGELQRWGALEGSVGTSGVMRRARSCLDLLASGASSHTELLEAAALAARLAGVPEATLYAAQIEVSRGSPHGALRIVGSRAGLRVDPINERARIGWAGTALWRIGDLDGAASRFEAASLAHGLDPTPNGCTSLLAASLAGAAVAPAEDLLRQLVELEGEDPPSLSWLVRSLEVNSENPSWGRLSAIALAGAARSSSDLLRMKLSDGH